MISKTIETIKAVDGVSLSIEKGEILGLVGESGCGKSTLSRTVMQLQPATSGQVVLDSEELTTLPKNEVRKRRLDFQMIFQDPYASLNPRMTVFSTLAEAICQRHPRYKKDSKLADKVVALMATVGLDSKYMQKYPHEFSGGQRQRLLLAVALVNRPRIIFLDEPTTGLDPQARRNFWDLVQSIRAGGAQSCQEACIAV